MPCFTSRVSVHQAQWIPFKWSWTERSAAGVHWTPLTRRSSTELGWRKTSKHVWRVSGPRHQLSGFADPLFSSASICLWLCSLHSVWGQILDDVKNRHVPGLKIFLGVEMTAESCPVLHSYCCGNSCAVVLMWGLKWDCIPMLCKILFLSEGHFRLKHISFTSEGNNCKIILEIEFFLNRFGYLSSWFIFSSG